MRISSSDFCEHGRSHGLFAGFLVLALAGAAAAQTPSGEQSLVDRLRTPGLRVRALVQGVVDYQPDRIAGGQDGFSIAAARLGLEGEFDNGIGYSIRAELISELPVLDARLSYAPLSEVGLDIGLFKVPLSGEMQIDAADIDFVNRSRAVSALAPDRLPGLQVRGDVAGGLFGFNVGLFNAGGFEVDAGGEHSGLLVVARLGSSITLGDAGSVTLGAAAARADDGGISAPFGRSQVFAGTRWLWSCDLRFDARGWLIAGEVAGAVLEPDRGASEEAFGLHLTLGYRPLGWLQMLVRWDSFSTAGYELSDDELVIGINTWPTLLTGVQLNVVLPLRRDLGTTRFLINAQLSL